jgi:hypothetical protein
MKTQILFISVFIAFAFWTCSDVREKSAKEMLESTKMREEIFRCILNDHDYLNTFLNNVLADTSAKVQLLQHSKLMKALCISSEMELMMKQDPEMMDHMAKQVIKQMAADSSMCDKTCTKMLEHQVLEKYFKEKLCLTKKELKKK